MLHKTIKIAIHPAYFELFFYWNSSLNKIIKVKLKLTFRLIFLYLKNYLFQRRRHNSYLWNQVSNGLRREDELFCFTWLILVCLRLWGTVRFFVNIIDDGSLDEKGFKLALLFLQSYGDSAQAFWNFMLFCYFDTTVRIQIDRL